MIRLLLLLLRQLIGGLGHRVETAGGVLLLHAAKSIAGLAEAVGGAARFGGAGILTDGAAHVVVGLFQAVERLLARLLAAVGGLGGRLLGVAGRVARLSGASTLSTTLSGTALSEDDYWPHLLASVVALLSLLPLLSVPAASLLSLLPLLAPAAAEQAVAIAAEAPVPRVATFPAATFAPQSEYRCAAAARDPPGAWPVRRVSSARRRLPAPSFQRRKQPIAGTHIDSSAYLVRDRRGRPDRARPRRHRLLQPSTTPCCPNVNLKGSRVAPSARRRDCNKRGLGERPPPHWLAPASFGSRDWRSGAGWLTGGGLAA